MVHIVCVKWGNLYSADYVNKLYDAIERNTKLDFDFTCFTEDPTNVYEEVFCRNLPFNRLTGWLAPRTIEIPKYGKLPVEFQ